MNQPKKMFHFYSFSRPIESLNEGFLSFFQGNFFLSGGSIPCIKFKHLFLFYSCNKKNYQKNQHIAMNKKFLCLLVFLSKLNQIALESSIYDHKLISKKSADSDNIRLFVLNVLLGKQSFTSFYIKKLESKISIGSSFKQV